MRDTSLTSPVNGIISKVNYEEGEVIGNAGNGVFFGEVISKDYIIEADIPESDISEIKKGQKAIILPDAFSEEAELKAEVIEIDPASTVIQEVVYYKTKLSFDPGDINIKEGMTADVEILIDKTKRAVKVSRRSVKEKNGEFFVEVINEEGDIAERKVEIGLKGDQGYVEIKSGLEAGEEIILDREEDEN
jgi:multidrug efflux pump subunit AcrA (membrane-fusion protein)